jgi:GNAT superfamily N-acetyltransferase
MKNNYLEYITEREGLSYINCKEGLAIYKKINKDTVYLQDIFVNPEYRKQGVATMIADKVADIAKENGCTYMLGSVCADANGATASLKVLLAYGFELKSVSGNMVYFIKGLS